MITLTERAEKELAAILGDGDRSLRLLVHKGGCAGFQYGIKVDDRGADDHVVSCNAGSVVIDPESLTYLRDVVLDYSDDLTDSGFKIRNPNAARSCGCGTSFEPALPNEQAPSYDPSMDGSVCGGGDEN